MALPFLLLILSFLAHTQQGTTQTIRETTDQVNLVIVSRPAWTSGAYLISLAQSTHLCRSLRHLRYGVSQEKSEKRHLIILLVFLISGDIELNPGPSHYPCGYCEQPVTWATRGVCCDDCSIWHHASCLGIGSSDYSKLNGSNISWHCFKCNSINLDSFTYHSYTLGDTSSNYYFPLTSSITSTKSTNQSLHSQKSPHVRPNKFNPLKASTPEDKRETRRTSFTSPPPNHKPIPEDASTSHISECSTPKSNPDHKDDLSSQSSLHLKSLFQTTDQNCTDSSTGSLPYDISKKQNLRIVTTNARSIRGRDATLKLNNGPIE